MDKHSKHIAVVGAGLVGSLLAIYLSRRGYHISVFERRPDMRKTKGERGRSINLALSNRGISALEEVGLAAELRNVAIPMNGRMMHDPQGNLTFLPYGREGQYINSISRSDLNIVLMNAAEQAGATFHFDHRCTNVNTAETTIDFLSTGTKSHNAFDLIIGADGAYSSIRSALQISDRFNFSQDYIEHGYKEFHIPPGTTGQYQLEKHALHIWPRESFMMIALPNPDASFTCTLFFPFEGDVSFNAIRDNERFLAFFKSNFTDALPLIPSLLEDFKASPPSSLLTVHCFPWVKNKTLLIGDAAHAIVPFYGQGMNAGFEDCRILNKLLDQYADDWDKVLDEFQTLRKPDTDAIAQLALDNFVEMRDLVADADFLLRKKIEAKLHSLYPGRWIPLYSMVTFHESIPYSKALSIGRKQKSIMDSVMAQPDIATSWQSLDFQKIVDQLTNP